MWEAALKKRRLINLKKKLDLKNLIFIDPVPKSQIPELVSQTGAGIVPLKNMPFFHGAIPSKIFDILGSKKPLLLGVEGEAYDLFIKEGNCGLFFEPENHKELGQRIIELYKNPDARQNLGENGYKFVSEFFNWDKIAEEFIAKVNEMF